MVVIANSQGTFVQKCIHQKVLDGGKRGHKRWQNPLGFSETWSQNQLTTISKRDFAFKTIAEKLFSGQNWVHHQVSTSVKALEWQM